MTTLIARGSLPLTSLDLGLVLDAVVGLASAQEILAAAAGLHMLNAHMNALADNAAVDLDGRSTEGRHSMR